MQELSRAKLDVTNNKFIQGLAMNEDFMKEEKLSGLEELHYLMMEGVLGKCNRISKTMEVVMIREHRKGSNEGQPP